MSEASGQPSVTSGYYSTILRLNVEAGTTYYIAVDSRMSTAGDIELVLNCRTYPSFLAIKSLSTDSSGDRLWLGTSYARTVDLEFSRDLLNWTNTARLHLDKEVEFVAPPHAGSNRFYRALTRD